MTTRTQLADPRTIRRAAAGRKMNKNEARALTAQIRATAHGLWRLVAEAYDRKAWQALGYSSWKDFATEELQMSESRSYQLVDTGRVMRAIGEVAGSEDVFETVVVTARETDRVKPHLSTFKSELRKALKDGRTPSDAVEVAIQALPSTEKRAPRPRHEEPGGIIDVQPPASAPTLPPIYEQPAAAKRVVPAPAVASPFAAPAAASTGQMLDEDEEFELILGLLREVYQRVPAKSLGGDLHARIAAALAV